MIWVVKQFIKDQTLGMEGERVKFPMRVELKYHQEGLQVSEGSLHKKILFKKFFQLKRYTGLKERDFDLLVEKKVQGAIEEVLAVQEGLSPQ